VTVRVYAVDRPELAPFAMPDRFRHDVTYFVTSPGEGETPENLGEGEWWVPQSDARRIFDEGVIRIVSPLDSASTAELEITEEQEAWLRWMIDNGIERIRLA
jgi:hypothetical protein